MATDIGSDPMLEIVGANKVFQRAKADDVWALKDVSLSVRRGEFVTIVGPSGCGKSTLLTAIAGLSRLSSGSMRVNGVEVKKPGADRSVVFQHASLLPWRTVRKNIAYGMEMQRSPGKSERRKRANWAMELVGLTGFADSYPSQLSGGMKQRANLARALATQPALLLMDEPFGALDAMTKGRLQVEVSRISQETSQTVLFVTHDIDEALLLADRVVVMASRPGRISKIVEVRRPRPRQEDFVESPEFIALRRELRLSIHGMDSDGAGPGVPAEVADATA